MCASISFAAAYADFADSALHNADYLCFAAMLTAFTGYVVFVCVAILLDLRDGCEIHDPRRSRRMELSMIALGAVLVVVAAYMLTYGAILSLYVPILSVEAVSVAWRAFMGAWKDVLAGPAAYRKAYARMRSNYEYY